MDQNLKHRPDTLKLLEEKHKPKTPQHWSSQ